MQDLHFRLRTLKEKVKYLTKTVSLKMKDNSVALEKEINSILLSSHSAILNQDQQQKLNSLKNDLNKLIDHEINSARLKSRITWAQKGDANTKFFHAVASACKNHNAIWSLQDEMDNWVSDDKILKDLGVRHCKTLFEDDHLTNMEAQLKVIRLFPSFIS